MGFEKRFPKWITAILALAQVVLTAAIIGLEFGSFYYDVAHGTIWAGFWASLVFIKTFLMMFCIIFSGALACVIIYFDAYFIGNLCKCYLGENLCCSLRGISTFNSNYGNVVKDCIPISSNGVQTVIDSCHLSPPTSKLSFLKAQLGCAIGMLAVCGLYVVLYLFACFGICFGHG
ncbi:unnamed protein product [Rotaria sordida]|uniref:Uncharacterized protein n=1 Tax=Rotaria sordida TaxID=392033 RepID=A0A819LPY0_9BILA|nr:unnamed protein product [Rotaria sordida]